MIHRDAPTVKGRTLWEKCREAENFNPEVIHSLDHPLVGQGGIVVLRGNLPSNGAVIKPSAATPELMKHTGRVVVLMTVAPPLILAGSAAFPLTCGLPKLFIHKHRFLATPLARGLRSGFTNPVLCWLAGTVTVIGWHLPVAFQLGMRRHSRFSTLLLNEE